MPDDGPLKPEDLQRIDDGLSQLKKLDLEIDKARRAGLDVTDQVKMAKDMKEQFLGIRRVYFPGKPLP